MADEVEVKMKVGDLAAVRDRLRLVNAEPQGERFETNAFFDTSSHTLRSRGDGLRLRTITHADGVHSAVITFKGPSSGTDVRRREEIEFTVGDVEAAAELLARLGYASALSFEKRRETWSLDGCLVELDVVARLGTFVEIEGDGELEVNAVRAKLGLADEPALSRGYASMIGALIAGDPSIGNSVTF